MIVRLPGVYPPQHDTSLLSDALLFEPLTAGSRVLDLCCGTGALSVAARRAGAGHVVAVDISRRAQVNTWLNAVVNRKRVDARRGDLTDAVGSELFDLIISNPPYVPAWDDALPTAGIARAWDAGKDGRSVLDRIAASAPDHVAPGGTLLLLQSALCGVDKTAAILEEFGMLVEVSARASVPFGPVMTGRRMMLESRGLITADQDTEQLVIIRATK
ncbi:methyltransferase [Rhodococcus sp. ACPA4]|uniref:HemK2/MTQ2 family protein methyltransferase n=1 Tax=Rhodococcus sp. ACPA4 TaxID=2028571 RepID=UPI000BB1622E|nr:HemK2/MTQ2 family protein methyltransferase [Rhodococcus sp. ACPA4]PBC42432.1 methyltransferase [Rhodococcus sp. ACPA4]